MSDDLKPCPFCGGEVGWRDGAIQCDRCRLSLRVGSYELTNDIWNTRAERTCRWVPFDEGHSIAGPGWRCSECGLELGPENAFVVEQCYCCPGCQSRVVE